MNTVNTLAKRSKNRLKVAVVGSGIAGLSSAWLLSFYGYEVHLYEKYESLGLGAHSVEVGPCSDVVDVPIRFFVEGFYTELLHLFRYVGIATMVASLSPSIQVYGQSSHFKLRNFILGKTAIPFVDPWQFLKNLSSYWLIFRDMFYFRKATLHMQKYQDLRSKLSKLTLAEYLVDNRYSKEFIDGFLIPVFAIVSTSSAWDSRNYPVTVAMDFLSNLFMTGKTTYRMTDGTQEASKILAKNVKTKHTNIEVKVIQPIRDVGGKLKGLEVHTSGLPVETFDHVIIATQANQALRILNEEEFLKRENALKGFRYVWSEAVIHSDERLMPLDQSSWSLMNVFTQPNFPKTNDTKIQDTDDQSPNNHKSDDHCSQSITIDPCQDLQRLNVDGLSDCSAGGAIMCTVWQNISQPLKMDGNKTVVGRKNVFQTWNPWIKPRPESVFPNGYHYFERPVVTIKTEQALEELNKIQGCDNIWFVGAYSQQGVPLLENGVDSGLTIAERISGQHRPWKRHSSFVVQNNVPGKMKFILITVLIVLLALCCFILYFNGLL